MAEEVGFEPTATITAAPLFESGTLNHSDTPPVEIIPPEKLPPAGLLQPTALGCKTHQPIESLMRWQHLGVVIDGRLSARAADPPTKPCIV